MRCPFCNTSSQLLYHIPDGLPELAEVLQVPMETVSAWIISGRIPVRVCNLAFVVGQEFVHIWDASTGLKARQPKDVP